MSRRLNFTADILVFDLYTKDGADNDLVEIMQSGAIEVNMDRIVQPDPKYASLDIGPAIGTVRKPTNITPNVNLILILTALTQNNNIFLFIHILV